MKYIKVVLFILSINNLIGQHSNKISGLIKYQVTSYGSGDTLGNGDMSHYEITYQKQEVSYFYIKHIKFLNDINGTSKVFSGEAKKYIRQYQNLDTKLLISTERAGGTSYLIKDTMAVIPWKLLSKSKKIQNIECFSAQAEYRGRIWTVWYAPSIPISSGPWKLYGLPGMILEAEDRIRSIRFECLAVIVPSSEEIEIPKHKDKQKNDNPITTTQFVKLYPSNIANYEKMMSDKNVKISIGIADIEIYEFEKDLPYGRKMQKLSDIPKK